jgi:hypothetical protein
VPVRNLVAPLLVFLLAWIIRLLPRLNFLLVRNELMSFVKFSGNCNFDILYSKPACHVVPKAFSMSKNTAAVDILLLKFMVIWSVSLIH